MASLLRELSVPQVSGELGDSSIQSWDASFGDAPGADYVVGQLWGRAGADRYLIVELRERMRFTQTVAAVRELNDYTAQRFRYCARRPILVEAAANGPAIIDHLRREIGGVIAVSPRGSKVSHAQAAQPLARPATSTSRAPRARTARAMTAPKPPSGSRASSRSERASPGALTTTASTP